MKQQQKKPEVSNQGPQQTAPYYRATPAIVEELIQRTGARGEITQVRCKILDGRDKNKVLRRNVKGPVKKGDMLMLRETDTEARRLGQNK